MGTHDSMVLDCQVSYTLHCVIVLGMYLQYILLPDCEMGYYILGCKWNKQLLWEKNIVY